MAGSSGFPRSARLLKPEQFERVFTGGARHSAKLLTAIAAANDCAHARLGLTVAKKAVALASDRNRLKRHIRESFRRHQQQLPAVDVIVTVRNGAAAITNPELRSTLEQLWTRIAKACAAS